MTPAMAQNYADGIEYYKSGQPDRAKIILERTLNDSETNQAESYYYLGEIAFPTSKDSAMMYFEKGIAANPEFATTSEKAKSSWVNPPAPTKNR